MESSSCVVVVAHDLSYGLQKVLSQVPTAHDARVYSKSIGSVIFYCDDYHHQVIKHQLSTIAIKRAQHLLGCQRGSLDRSCPAHLIWM